MITDARTRRFCKAQRVFFFEFAPASFQERGLVGKTEAMKLATASFVAATSLALTLTACGSSGTSSGGPARTDTIAKLTGSATAGKTVYTQNCATCHGTDAKSGSAAKNITGESASEAYSQILEGGGGMQSFSNLSDQDIANVWSYVQTLK